MKVAVSIPDDLFAEAEALAKRMRRSRSEIYSRALSELMSRHTPTRVTAAMNEVVADLGVDPGRRFGKAAARRVIQNVEW